MTPTARALELSAADLGRLLPNALPRFSRVGAMVRCDVTCGDGQRCVGHGENAMESWVDAVAGRLEVE